MNQILKSLILTGLMLTVVDGTLFQTSSNGVSEAGPFYHPYRGYYYGGGYGRRYYGGYYGRGYYGGGPYVYGGPSYYSYGGAYPNYGYGYQTYGYGPYYGYNTGVYTPLGGVYASPYGGVGIGIY